jgi:hypothetical protein
MLPRWAVQAALAATASQQLRHAEQSSTIHATLTSLVWRYMLLCRAVQAALAATASPLLEVGINQATGIVWNITGPPDMSLFEVRLVALCVVVVAAMRSLKRCYAIDVIMPDTVCGFGVTGASRHVPVRGARVSFLCVVLVAAVRSHKAMSCH